MLSFVKCNSKEGVLATLKEFKSLYQPNPRAMFFVDRDHDDLVGEQPDAYLYLFVTDGYSIENELCSDSVVRRHCVETLGLDSQHVAVERAVGQFGAAFGSFEEAVRMPMAWIVAARRKGKVNIRNVVSKTLLYFDSEKMRVTLASSWDDSVAYLCRVTGDNGPHPGVSGDELDSAQRDMAMVAPKVWMRGKQCVWFCVQFLNAIAVSFRAVGLFEKVHRLDEANAIQDLAPRVSPSATLRSFLERVVQALVNP
ncbi:DUF4435 domain-containing protein [Nannocystis pusilla]|uniref:DUF4435 domain-containing protein n=1 Tax=Nannocystis pusilla TaxID=889268 RepID=A0A9X3ETY8_9BACT|nr:DUF4435 domain-containing protein [Nannocystis pusilla]